MANPARITAAVSGSHRSTRPGGTERVEQLPTRSQHGLWTPEAPGAPLPPPTPSSPAEERESPVPSPGRDRQVRNRSSVAGVGGAARFTGDYWPSACEPYDHGFLLACDAIDRSLHR